MDIRETSQRYFWLSSTYMVASKVLSASVHTANWCMKRQCTVHQSRQVIFSLSLMKIDGWWLRSQVDQASVEAAHSGRFEHLLIVDWRKVEEGQVVKLGWCESLKLFLYQKCVCSASTPMSLLTVLAGDGHRWDGALTFARAQSILKNIHKNQTFHECLHSFCLSRKRATVRAVFRFWSYISQAVNMIFLSISLPFVSIALMKSAYGPRRWRAYR